MTATGLPRTSRPRAAIDIAGTAWPVYKLEALVVGLLVFVATLVPTQTLEPAVLGAAAATVVVWWARRRYWNSTGH